MEETSLMHHTKKPFTFAACVLAASLAGCGADTTTTPDPTSHPAPNGETKNPRLKRIPTIRFSGNALTGEARRLHVRDIESIGVVSFAVYDPYTEKTERYSGVPLGDLIKKHAPTASHVLITAIDDYQVKLTAAEWAEHEIFLATQHNRAHLTVASKGPARVVFKHASGDRATIAKCKPKWIWQIAKIEFVN